MITKSDLQSFLQCPRKLWLERHRPDLLPKEDPMGSRRATDGNIVGAEARRQLGPEALMPAGEEDPARAAEAARALLQTHPARPAAEVPMVHGELYARADALLPVNGRYVLRETKSSTLKAKVEEHYLDDVAIQHWVMEGWGLPIERVELNLLDNQWRYPGDGDYAGLFTTRDVTAESAQRKAQVSMWLAEAQRVLVGDMPATTTGRHCGEPYDCPFKMHCAALDPPGPEHPLELLPGPGKMLARKLHSSRGYTSLLEPRPEEFTGAQAPLYRRIQAAHRSGEPVLEPNVRAVMAALAFPRYYFDFEGIDFPVPRWTGVRPYEHVPFQWSCHIERAPGVFEHAEFLDLSGDDPSLACIDQMRRVIDPADAGPIIVYHKTYESEMLRHLAERHPQHTALLQGWQARLVDLRPIVTEHYYHPDMRGSFSIKKVLPAVAPHLRYDDLDEIHEGTAAQMGYLQLLFDAGMTSERRADLERNLRAYCRQDTWAMVEVAHYLADVGRPVRPVEG